MLELLLTIGIGAAGLYYVIKVYTRNCNQNRIGVENIIVVEENGGENEDEIEVPPKYEDINA